MSEGALGTRASTERAIRPGIILGERVVLGGSVRLRFFAASLQNKFVRVFGHA